MAVSTHLDRQAADFVSCADCFLGFGEELFLVHTQLLSHKSPVFSTFWRIALPAAGERHASETWNVGPLPVVRLQAHILPPDVAAVSQSQFANFLRHIYEVAAPVKSVEEAEFLLLLGDYFQVEEVVARCETWMCSRLRRLGSGAPLDAGSEDLACSAFELAIKHRLADATALLLPWALQRLSHGSRQGVVWYDTEQRRARIQACLSPQLKALCMDTFWWSQSGCACTSCGCRPEDITPAFDFAMRRPWRRYWAEQTAMFEQHGVGGAAATGAAAQGRQAWAQQHTPSQGYTCPYQRAVAHFAHLLREGAWGDVPAAASQVN